MSDDSDASARFLPRICEGLDKLPLTDEQKVEIAPKILAGARFLDTRGGRVHDGNLREDSRFFDFEAKIRSVVGRFAAQGLNTRDYLQAALNQPSLFAQSPVTIAGNIDGVVDRFAADGLTTRDYLQAALKQPQLFYQSPDTIGRHIDIILDLYDNGVFTLPRSRGHAARQNDTPQPHAAVIASLLKNSAILCLEDNNYVLRELHQRMTGADPSPKNLNRSRRETEYELMRHLGHNDPRRPVPGGFIAGQGPPTDGQARNFVLRALVREGYIKGAKLER